MNGTRTTFDRHGGQKQTLRMRARCFMGYGIKIFSPALRNDVTRSPGWNVLAIRIFAKAELLHPITGWFILQVIKIMLLDV